MFRDSKKSHANFTDEHLAALDACPERIRNPKLGGRFHPVTSDGRMSLEHLRQSICVLLLFGKPGTEIVRMSIPEVGFQPGWRPRASVPST